MTLQVPLPPAALSAVQLPSTDDLDGSLELPKATYRLVSGVGFTTAPTRKEKRLSSTYRRLPTVLIWPSCAAPPVVLSVKVRLKVGRASCRERVCPYV